MKCCQYDIFENMSKSFALLQKDEITDINKLVQNHLQSFIGVDFFLKEANSRGREFLCKLYFLCLKNDFSRYQ